MVAFAMTAMVACGNGGSQQPADDDGAATEATAQDGAAVKGTYSFADAEHSYGLQVLDKMLNFSVIDLGDASLTPVIYSAPYTYDASTRDGSAEMKDSRDGSAAGQATFSFDPASETVTITFQSKTVALEKQQPVKL